MMPIYIKTTNACNLSCEHCFIAKADKADKRMMNTEQVGIIMDKLKTYYKYDMLQFNWYGGEPMMSGISFFNHILANYKDERIIHYLQTNLTLINEKWYPIIEKLFDGSICTSYDLSRRLGDSYDAFYQKWWKTYEKTKEQFDIVVRITITKETTQKGASWVTDIIGQLDANIIILDYFFPNGTKKKNKKKLFVPYHDYYAFAENIKRLCREKHPNTTVEINNNIRKVSTVNGDDGHFCSTCADNMLVIEPDGSVYNCIIMSGEEEHYIGNILHDDVEDIIFSTKNIEHIVKQKSFYCDCEHYQNCNGGCYLIRSATDKADCKRVFAESSQRGRSYVRTTAREM